MRSLVRFAYEAIESPEKRKDFVKIFAEAVDAPAAAIIVEDLQLRWATMPFTYGIDQGTIDSYIHHYVRLNPMALRGSSAAGEVRTRDELISDREFEETEFYHGWYRPRGWSRMSSIIVQKTEDYRAYLWVPRPSNHRFTKSEIAVHKSFAPHLATAAQIGKTLADHKSTIERLRSGALERGKLVGLKLTDAELRAATGIFINGQTPKEYAFTAGLKVSTVRWYVQQIYNKTDYHSGPDLIRFLQNHRRK